MPVCLPDRVLLSLQMLLSKTWGKVGVAGSREIQDKDKVQAHGRKGPPRVASDPQGSRGSFLVRLAGKAWAQHPGST